MADMKQILVVDDTAEMLELLRSLLQVSGNDHQVLGVPSAEEAWMELTGRVKFDLLITDVRLPGMSGFDLVRRARRRHPDLSVIMITAYESEQGRQEADELGIYRYFRKPLDTDSVLTAVHHALYGEPEMAPVVETAPFVKVNVELTDDIEFQLDSLRDKTGAFGLLLVAGGHVVYESGGHRDLHPDRIAAIVNQKMAHSSMLAEELGEGDSSFNLLYQSGARYEMYSVNIGLNYFVTLLFEASARRGRIGTVWIFVQRAVKDLEKILPPLNLETAVTPLVEEPLPKTVPAPPPQVKSEPKATLPPSPPVTIPEPEPEPEPKPEPIELSEEEMAAFAGLFAEGETADASVDFDAFWDSALDSTDSGSVNRGLSLAEAQEMGLVDMPDIPSLFAPEPAEAESEAETEPEVEEPEVEPIDVAPEELGELFANVPEADEDFDAFWDMALDDDGAGQVTRGISFEDAIKQGLVPGDFGEEA